MATALALETSASFRTEPPLKPNQPIQRMNVPSVAIGSEANAIAPNAIAPNASAPSADVTANPTGTNPTAGPLAPVGVVVTEAVATGLLRPKGAPAEGPAPSEDVRRESAREPAPRDRPATDHALPSEPTRDDTAPRSTEPSAEGPRPTHERRSRRDDVPASGRSVEATPTETARAVQAPDAVRPGTPTLDVVLVPVSTHEAPSPSLAPPRESLVHDPYDSMFPERPPLAATSFLDGSVLPGTEGASTRLELQHPTLGALTLHLAQVGDGVNVDFSAPTLDAAIALRASEEGLRAELRESGAELGGFRVRTRRAAIAHEGDARETEAWQPAGRHDRRRV